MELGRGDAGGGEVPSKGARALLSTAAGSGPGEAARVVLHPGSRLPFGLCRCHPSPDLPGQAPRRTRLAHRHPGDDGGLALDEPVHLPHGLVAALVLEPLPGEFLQRLLELLEGDGAAALPSAGREGSGTPQSLTGTGGLACPALPLSCTRKQCSVPARKALPGPWPIVFTPSSRSSPATAANTNCLGKKLKGSTSFTVTGTLKQPPSGSRWGVCVASTQGRTDFQRKIRLRSWLDPDHKDKTSVLPGASAGSLHVTATAQGCPPQDAR